jgi:hypothetical protein
MRIITRCAVAGVLASAMLIALPGVASAHEGRHVGEWHFTVGWGEEPSYAGKQNSVQLILEDHDDKPVVDLGDTLKVEVAFGSDKQTFSLEPAFKVGIFGEPGDYRAYLTPTRSGTYTFTFTGTIKGDRINAKFTCGPKTFDCANDPAEIQFPAKDPSNAQLAERIDRETKRVDTDLKKTASIAKDDTKAANTMGLIGIIVGALGLIVALVAVLTGRRKAA